MKRICAGILCFLLTAVSFADDFTVIMWNTNSEIQECTISERNKRYVKQSCRKKKKPRRGGVCSARRRKDGKQELICTTQDDQGKRRLERFKETLESVFVGPNVTDLRNLTATNDFITYDFGNRVVLQNLNAAGRPTGGRRNLLTPPSGVDPFDTFIALSDSEIATIFSRAYGSLFYANSQNRYGVVFGKTDDPSSTKAFSFKGDVVSAELVLGPEGRMNFVYLERLPALPLPRFTLKNTILNSNTFEPISQPITLVPPKAQNLGSAAFFNPVTVIPSVFTPNGAHVCFSEMNPAINGTDLKCFFLNTNTGRRVGPIVKVEPGTNNTIFYGLTGTVIPAN